MASRLPRFLVLFSLIALVTTLFVMSGFPRTPKAPARLAEAPVGREGGSRTVTRSAHVPIETHAPPVSDSVLQSNMGSVVANDSRWEIRKQHQRSETFRIDGGRLFPVGLSLRGSRDYPRDH